MSMPGRGRHAGWMRAIRSSMTEGKHCAPKGKRQRFWRQTQALLAESKIVICQMTYKSVRTEGAAGHSAFYHGRTYGA